MGQKTNDIFEARLERLKDDNLRPDSVATATASYPRKSQNSVLLPIMATALLLVGGTSFALMLALPDPSGFSVAYSDAQPLEIE